MCTTHSRDVREFARRGVYSDRCLASSIPNVSEVSKGGFADIMSTANENTQKLEFIDMIDKERLIILLPVF